MGSMRKNKKGVWTISIQSLGFNTTFSSRTTKKVEASRLNRQIESRIDRVKIDGAHDFHDWSKAEKLEWIKTGMEPKLDFDPPITVAQAITDYLEYKRSQERTFNTTRGYEFHLRAAKKKFGKLALKDLSAKNLQDWVLELSKTVIDSGANRGKRLSIKTQKEKVASLRRVVRHFQSLGEPGINASIFDAVSYGKAETDELSELSPWIDFDRRVLELERLGINQVTEGAFKEIILTEAQLKEQLEYLETKLFNDGTLVTIRLFAAIQLCCFTGARRSELVRIRRRDLLLADNTPLVTLLKRKGRKNKDLLMQKMVLPNRIVPILQRLLRLLPADQQCLFDLLPKS